MCAFRRFVLLGAGLLLGCSDDGNGGDKSCPKSFGQAEACGGSFEGSWTYVSACTDDDLISEYKSTCPTVSSSNVALAINSGALSLTGDNYDLDVSVQVSGTLHVPQSCATLAGGCSGLPPVITTALGAGATATCTGTVDCTCSVSYSVTNNQSGTLTTSGGIATLDTGQHYYYCARGGALRYRGVKDQAGDDDKITYVLNQ